MQATAPYNGCGSVYASFRAATGSKTNSITWLLRSTPNSLSASRLRTASAAGIIREPDGTNYRSCGTRDWLKVGVPPCAIAHARPPVEIEAGR